MLTMPRFEIQAYTGEKSGAMEGKKTKKQTPKQVCKCVVVYLIELLHLLKWNECDFFWIKSR